MLMKIQAIWDMRMNKLGDNCYQRFVRIVSSIFMVVQEELKLTHQTRTKLR